MTPGPPLHFWCGFSGVNGPPKNPPKRRGGTGQVMTVDWRKIRNSANYGWGIIRFIISEIFLYKQKLFLRFIF